MDHNAFVNDFTVDFDKDFVTDKLNQIFATKAYQLREQNELLNTWRFNGVFAVTKAYGSTIQLVSADTNKTNIKIQTYNLQGGGLDTSLLSQAQSEFLNILTKALQGEEVNFQSINSSKKGCFGVILFLITSASLIALLML